MYTYDGEVGDYTHCGYVQADMKKSKLEYEALEDEMQNQKTLSEIQIKKVGKIRITHTHTHTHTPHTQLVSLMSKNK